MFCHPPRKTARAFDRVAVQTQPADVVANNRAAVAGRHASERCPVFPSSAKRIHHNFSDPAKATGSEEEIRSAFAAVREEIKHFCAALVV
jgi:protein-tyrosine-phosphatase